MRRGLLTLLLFYFSLSEINLNAQTKNRYDFGV